MASSSRAGLCPVQQAMETKARKSGEPHSQFLRTHLHCTHLMSLPTFCTIAPQMMSPGPGPLDRSRASQYLSRQDQSEVASWPERRSMSHPWEGDRTGTHPLLPRRRGFRFAPSLRGELQRPQSCKAARAGGPSCQVRTPGTPKCSDLGHLPDQPGERERGRNISLMLYLWS